MKLTKAISLVGAAALLVCGLAACSPAANDAGSSGSVSMSVSEAQGEAKQAIVLHVEDGIALFADKDTESVYVPGLPEGQIFGLDGEAIAADELQAGNIVEVIGNGIMLESYPGQYPGITRIVVVEEGTPENIAPYQDVIAQVFAESDPYAVALGHVDYTTDQASVSLALDPVSSMWDSADGFRIAQDGAVYGTDGVLLDSVPDARIDDATQATVGFDKALTDIQVTSQPLTRASADSKMQVVLGVQDLQAVSVEQTGAKTATFTMEPGNLYTINGFFENGSATYSFYAPLIL